jgi:hypothetical protein
MWDVFFEDLFVSCAWRAGRNAWEGMGSDLREFVFHIVGIHGPYLFL